jgi:histone H3/H4
MADKRTPIDFISDSAIRKLARTAGIKRLGRDQRGVQQEKGERSKLVYTLIRDEMKDFLMPIISDAVIIAQHANRNTITENDIKFALKRHGIVVYM